MSAARLCRRVRSWRCSAAVGRVRGMGQGREVWAVGDAYEEYVGRWSRLVAAEFLRWLQVPEGLRWLDVGCGTGALTSTILETAAPAQVIGVDTSERFVAGARARVADGRAAFGVADAQSLPLPDGGVDAVVSALAVNFVPDPCQAVAQFARTVGPGGAAAAYVWDYAEGMALIRYFWDAAITLDPAAEDLDEGRRFPLCRPDPLGRLWCTAGFEQVAVTPIEIPAVFTDFDDYWKPFLGGQGPAPAYATSLPDTHRQALRDLLRARLPASQDGAIRLTARAWAVRGTRPAATRTG